MRIGISAFAWTGSFEESHLALLPAIRKMGFDCIEIPISDPASLAAGRIREAVEANNLACTACALLPPSMNPISPQADVRRAAIRHLTRCIETTAAMGAKLLGGPLYAPIGYLPEHRPSEDEWTWAVEAFKALSPVLEENGVALAIEPVNRSETFFLRTADEARRLCERVGNPRIGVTIDTFHSNIEERDIPAAIRSLGAHLKHIHASENDRGPLGRGHVPFPEIVRALGEMHFSGYLMIEGFGYSPAEEYAPGTLWACRDVSPEGLAMESAEYLRRLMAESAS
jgi:D-psicose/D-tagatose/L-ribulose 3-epimerase